MLLVCQHEGLSHYQYDVIDVVLSVGRPVLKVDEEDLGLNGPIQVHLETIHAN